MGILHAGACREDLIGIEVDKGSLVEFNKSIGPIESEARKLAKPSRCKICGTPTTDLCRSHTIPKYCLKEIAQDGELLSFAALLGGNLRKKVVGISGVMVFKMICKRCDTEYFKLYETPETLFESPTNQVMAQIAVKCLLNRIYHANCIIQENKLLGESAPMTIRARATSKEYDKEEYERAYRSAVAAGRKDAGAGFKLIFHRVVPYVAPFAFQQMIALESDFDGGLINNLHCYSRNYRTDWLYVCVLPSKGCTVVTVFRRADANRYRDFEAQLAKLTDAEALLAIIKIIFAYSEDVYLSKAVKDRVACSEELKALAAMENKYSGFGESYAAYRKAVEKASMQDFAIKNLPKPPALLSREYAVG